MCFGLSVPLWFGQCLVGGPDPTPVCSTSEPLGPEPSAAPPNCPAVSGHIALAYLPTPGRRPRGFTARAVLPGIYVTTHHRIRVKTMGKVLTHGSSDGSGPAGHTGRRAYVCLYLCIVLCTVSRCVSLHIPVCISVSVSVCVSRVCLECISRVSLVYLACVSCVSRVCLCV